MNRLVRKMRAQFNSLPSHDGWLDGQGKSIDKATKHNACEVLTKIMTDDEDLFIPRIYPREDGFVQLETKIRQWTIEVVFSNESVHGTATDLATDEDIYPFDISSLTTGNWRLLLEWFLRLP